MATVGLELSREETTLSPLASVRCLISSGATCTCAMTLGAAARAKIKIRAIFLIKTVLQGVIPPFLRDPGRNCLDAEYLPSVFVKSFTALASEPTRVDIFPEQRARPVFWISKTVM